MTRPIRGCASSRETNTELTHNCPSLKLHKRAVSRFICRRDSKTQTLTSCLRCSDGQRYHVGNLLQLFRVSSYVNGSRLNRDAQAEKSLRSSSRKLRCSRLRHTFIGSCRRQPCLYPRSEFSWRLFFSSTNVSVRPEPPRKKGAATEPRRRQLKGAAVGTPQDDGR